jgi:hypothetical protein
MTTQSPTRTPESFPPDRLAAELYSRSVFALDLADFLTHVKDGAAAGSSAGAGESSPW